MSVFNRKLNAVKNHITDNRGDENVAKMIWIAVAFIIGAIILALLTWAFKTPITNWFKSVINSWFNTESSSPLKDATWIEGGGSGGTGSEAPGA